MHPHTPIIGQHRPLGATGRFARATRVNPRVAQSRNETAVAQNTHPS